MFVFVCARFVPFSSPLKSWDRLYALVDKIDLFYIKLLWEAACCMLYAYQIFFSKSNIRVFYCATSKDRYGKNKYPARASEKNTFPNSFINFIGTGWRHIECKIIYRKICLAACTRRLNKLAIHTKFRMRVFFNSFYFICSTRCALIQRSPGFIFVDKTKKDHTERSSV